jgi:exosortase/archaeosortase family protein
METRLREGRLLARAAFYRHPAVVAVLQAAACSPVWPWYAARVRDGSDEPWCVLAVVAALVVIARGGGKPAREGKSFALPAMLLAAYAAAAVWLPPIFGAAIAFLAVGSSLHYWRWGCFFNAGVWGLLVLGTPLMSSVQFYLGYPLRVLVGYLSAPLIHLSGFTVTVEGTLLNWGGKLVEIDAPCSGIRMLWTGMFLSFLLAAAYRWRPGRTFLYGMAAAVAVVSANVMRAAALFYIEAVTLPFPPWAHSAVGVVVFAWMAFWGLRAAGGPRERTI